MEGFIYCMCERRGAWQRGVELIDRKSGGGGSVGGGPRRVMPAVPPLVYMMPQEDKGLAIWQVQADWQY